MHELSLAENINNTIKELCERSALGRVRRVVLEVGRMRQVDPELLAFAFDVVSRGTVTEGAEVSILELPIVFMCHSCNREAGSDLPIFVCANCGGRNVELRSGMELNIESMEVEGRQVL